MDLEYLERKALNMKECYLKIKIKKKKRRIDLFE
jgi:hypothetical protein